MTIDTVYNTSFTKNIIVHCPTFEDARYFLHMYFYNLYKVRPDNTENSSVRQKAESIVNSILMCYNRDKSNTCYNIKEGQLTPITLTYIEKYGLNYPYTLVKCVDIRNINTWE